MPQLIQIILHAPSLPLPHRISLADLTREDLVWGVGGRVGDDVAFGVAEHGFAHGVESAVGAGEGYRAGPEEVAEAVGAVGDFPGGFYRGCVACCAKHDLGALVGGFTGLVGWLPWSMADDWVCGLGLFVR